MKEIKKKFKPFYDEKSGSLKLEDFILFEMALMMAVHLKKDSDPDPNKGYLLFTKYHQIGKWDDPSDLYLIQNACIYLKKFRSEKQWKDTLKEYRKEEYAGIRLYHTCDGRIVEKETANLPYPDRKQDYLNYIGRSVSRAESRMYATHGWYQYKIKNNEDKVADVYLNEDIAEEISSLPIEAKPREKIEIKIESLIEAAEEMRKFLPGDPCAEILKNIQIKAVNGKSVKPAESLTIERVVNIVGMVGAGKTTLLKVLTYLLNQKQKKTVIVTDTVADVFNLYQYFHALGCSCSPLIGKGERLKQINRLIGEDADYLDEDKSRYLTACCLIDGFNTKGENTVAFGEEPCTGLKKGRKNYVCPFFDRCPVTAMQREALESNVVITTVAGFVSCRVGKMQRLYLEEVIEKADVVFFDECDRAQKMLDHFIAPATEFNAFIKECAEEYHRFMLESNAKRMEDPEGMYYAELQSKSPTVLACVSNAVKAAKRSGRKQVLSDTFSAYTLLDGIKNEISEHTAEEIYRLMDYEGAERSSLYDVMIASCESIKTDRYERLLEEWLERNKTEEIQNETRKKLQLILTLIFFDKFIVNIGDAYENSRDLAMGDNELVGFIRTRFRVQQDYLPSALMGNLFGIQSANEDDILLFRQYAYGRTLLTNLPFIRVNREGEPIGPHAILLSGSSYAKGSYEYHVNAEVSYLIESDRSVRDFIARTQFVELGLEERVSGSPLEAREEVLRKVVDKCTPCIVSELENEGKILLVVNSFAQAEAAAARLRANLNKRGCKEAVCALVSDQSPDKGESEQTIRRGEVYKFDKRKARILVAPALAIERGHNIVDEQGHSSLSSVFFLIRPMGVPDDIKEKCIKMNGYIAAKMQEYQAGDLYERNLYVRQEAIKFWNRMNQSAKRRLDYLDDPEIRTDLVATMFVLILQIFGRLCRVTDAAKNPPTVYFADGAFRKRSGEEDGFDTLKELGVYMKKMLADSENGEVARTLYEPFVTAYTGGIRNE